MRKVTEKCTNCGDEVDSASNKEVVHCALPSFNALRGKEALQCFIYVKRDADKLR